MFNSNCKHFLISNVFVLVKFSWHFHALRMTIIVCEQESAYNYKQWLWLCLTLMGKLCWSVTVSFDFYGLPGFIAFIKQALFCLSLHCYKWIVHWFAFSIMMVNCKCPILSDFGTWTWQIVTYPMFCQIIDVKRYHWQ